MKFPDQKNPAARMGYAKHWTAYVFRRLATVSVAVVLGVAALAQPPGRPAKIELGSQTAKGGFRNEDEIRDKFNNWKLDEDARQWLAAMNYRVEEIESVIARKPHGEKADVEVAIKLKKPLRRTDAKSEPGAIATGSPSINERREGISIKLVSSPQGFNQIDKRWLSVYAKMWRMPPDVVNALKLFVGEIQQSLLRNRMYLKELDPKSQQAVVDFFTAHKNEIVADLFQGDGAHSAGWFMVALKANDKTRWTLRPVDDAIKFFGEGKVEITRAGNLKIGRITMQRKGGDGGRKTAKMLQFKINPVLLFAYRGNGTAAGG